jgi:hypothetical protein
MWFCSSVSTLAADVWTRNLATDAANVSSAWSLRIFGVSQAPPNSAAMCDAPRSLTGKMNAMEPGVCPGTTQA